MNKLSQQDIELIRKTIDIAHSNEITDISFKENRIGGYSSEVGIFILQEMPEKFSFPPLAVSRLDSLKKRLAMVDNLSHYDVFYDDDGKKITKLTFKSKRTKIEFRCIDPEKVKFPVRVNDPVWFSFDMDAETLTVLNRVTTAMDTKTISLIGKKSTPGLLLKVEDENRDVLEHETESKITWNDDGSVDEFNFVYSTKKISRLIRDAVLANYRNVKITKRGFMITQSKGITVYTIAEL
jgi:hypothetical protein